MTGSPPPLELDATGQLAASIPGFDPTTVINAADKGLADYLAMPTQQILDKFGLQQSPSPASAVPATSGAPANPGGSINPVDPTQLISPVVNALGTLGNGQFSGMDPTSMLNGISSALGGISGPVQQALAAVQHGWQGASSAAAAAKTGAALANGAEVATQATGLQNSLSAAAADVAQAQTQLIAIINEFLATLAAIGPNIMFPWGWAAVVAAAAHAVAQTAQVMAEVQSSLAAQASAVTAIGAPVAVTAAHALGASTAGAMGPTSAMSILSPLMSVASAGISPALSAASMAASPAASAGAQSATLAGSTAPDPKSDPKSAAGGGAPAGKGGAGGAPVLPAGGGGGAATGALVSRLSAPMPPAAAETTTTAIPAGPTRPATGAIPMGGGGMMGAPPAGVGQGAGAGGAHTAASFLHTSDQGGKVFGDRNTVAPPVIGEVDPSDTPDIELRI